MISHVMEIIGNRITSKELRGKEDWADYVADRVIELFPDLEVYTCAAGISPSGVVHFGNFRDIMTALAVKEALQNKGKRARLLFSWDNYDRFRKVPKNVEFEDFKDELGLPLTKVHSPESGSDSWAKFFQAPLEKSLEDLGIEIDYKNQTELYTAGTYRDRVIEALQKRKEIGEILYSFMSEKARNEKYPDKEAYLDSYYPVAVYSEFTGKDNTEIVGFEGTTLTYRCLDTDKESSVDLNEFYGLKLAWKIDWPMRWGHEQVVFEPGGKDHASPGGSYDVSQKIAKDIFGIEPPVFVGYDFVGLQGLDGKMSSSAGNAVSPGELLEIYTPELLMWLYTRVAPYQSFNLAFDTEIYRQYDEFDRQFPTDPASISFRQTVGFGQLVDWDYEDMLFVLKENDFEVNPESVKIRLPKAKNWLETYNQDQMLTPNTEPRPEYFAELTDGQKGQIEELVREVASREHTIESLTELVYSIPKEEGQSEDDQKKAQREFFKMVYQLLFSEDRGPRLPTYIYLKRDQVLDLLQPLV